VEQKSEQNNFLDAAEAELRLLLEKKTEIAAQKQALVEQEVGLDNRISFVRRTIKSLALVYGGTETAARVADLLETAETAAASPKITDSVRDILQFRYPNYLLPTVVRDYLRMRGIEVKGENPMAVVHQVLRRLADQGWADPIKMVGGGLAYRQKRAGAPPAGRIESSPSVVVTTNPETTAKKATTVVARARKRG